MTSHPTRPAEPSVEVATIRCGAVGVGRMGRHHARVYADLPDAELVGVIDADSERAGEVAERHACPCMTDVRELIDAGVEAVSIAVPTTAHLDIAAPFLEAGVACLIEKPLSYDAESAQRLKDLAVRHDALLMVGHIERFNPIMRALREATANGPQIRARFIEVHRVSPMTFRSVDIGVVMDMMIHDLDVVIMLMDGAEPDEIQAAGVAVVTEHEDICNARLTFRRPYGTCVANVTASRLALKTERVTRITGENAYVKIDYGAKSGTIIRRTANELQMQEMHTQLRQGADLTDLNWNELVNIDTLEVDDSEPIVEEVRAFLDAVRTGATPEIDAEAGLANVRTAERIIQAIREFMGGQ